MSKRANVGNAGDSGQVRSARTKVRLAERQWRDDVRAVLSTPAGERFVRRVLAECGPFHDDWTSDTNTMYRLSGQRAIGLWLLREIGAADRAAQAKLMSEPGDDEPDTEDTPATPTGDEGDAEE